MEEYINQNKSAWEFDAYQFWVKNSGTPKERAKKDIENPTAMLKKYAKYFDTYEDIKVANICGSCGKKAIPLALLGAKTTIFDISKDNMKYALEVAEHAKVHVDYVLGDVLSIDMSIYGEMFDVVFMEGGILHYFHSIDDFMKVMYGLLKKNGKIICSDFHPFRKIVDTTKAEWNTKDYFSTDIIEGEMAHASFYPEDIRNTIPKCSYRMYTISEIINGVLRNGFEMKQFDEHPSWLNEKVPGEFTVIAYKK